MRRPGGGGGGGSLNQQYIFITNILIIQHRLISNVHNVN